MAENIVGRRERINLDTYTNAELIERYRLDRQGINFVAHLVSNDINAIAQRNNALDAVVKTMVTLRFLATGKYQLCNGDDTGVSQPTVSRAVTQVITSLSSQQTVNHFINFPVNIFDIRRNQLGFFNTSQFPGVVGVIDGTHIQIQAPRVNENEFVNRHRYHSINTQVVFDARDHIIDVVARWPGSTHDSRILTNSGLFQLFEGNHLARRCHLLGDSGYPCRPWLLTPYLNPQPGSQANYNRAHIRTRSRVERGIGQWKRRFAVLHGEIRLSPEKAVKVITSCAVLHNICKVRNIPLPNHNGAIEMEGQQYMPPLAMANNGLRYRDNFAATNF